MQDKLFTHFKDHQTTLVTLVVLAVLALLFGALVWNVYRTLSSVDTHQTSSRAAPAAAQSGRQGIQIASANLFGTLDQSGMPNASNNNLPQTSLQLMLRGAFTAVEPSKGSAIIEDAAGNAKHHRVGSEVIAGTTLQSVEADKVILSRDGQLETLYFPEPSADASSIADDIATTVDNNNAVQTTDGGEVSQAQASEMAMRDPTEAARIIQNLTPEQRRAIIKQRLEELRSRAR